MSNNHRYEQIPLDNQTNVSTRLPQQQQQQQRSDLEDTFDLNEEEEEEEVRTQTESNRLLPSSTDHTPYHIVSIPSSNDGVFSNMSAKPESDSTKPDEIPPSYEEASADATPPYWQTTIIAPADMGDATLVEGLPVGSLLSFFWNLTVSASFQLVGFMLTYLLHTTHAAKDGARAGLGISLIQYGFFVRSRGTLDEDFDYDGEGHETGQDATQADIVAYLMMFLGWFIVLRAVSDYYRARNVERIITAEPNADVIV
ncbi:hypothetical protein EDC94DRAFT_603665 [Helicostylum pulchrum]|nr:hypothetical protein EDC94DRAFT_603665 [Helicostylum pulchrum]